MPGEHPLQDVVAASRPYLAQRTYPAVLYLPAAGSTVEPRHVELTRTAFGELGRVVLLDLTRPVPLMDIESALGQADVLLIPGGNTYWLLENLRRRGAFELIQARVRSGLPLVGFSAGMLVCGQNILTSNNQNDCGSTEFAGFGFTEYNLAAHYPADGGAERVRRDARIHEYHTHHANPVLALEDDGYVEIDDEGAAVVRGHCWLFEPGFEQRLLARGRIGRPSA
jgi:peptidase E